VIKQIEKLMEDETAGDPMRDLKWTRRSTERVANELASIGIRVSKTTVGRLLKKLDFSLKSNAKKISNGGKSMTTDQQKRRDTHFRFINRVRALYERHGAPMISVDTKKKELIGNFKNAGTRMRRIADLANDHDYRTYALGQAAPYGILDPVLNKGFVCVGKFMKEGKIITSSDTPDFAVDSIARWWQEIGSKDYSKQGALLILADAGGSNGSSPHMWKVGLQQKICNRFGLRVTVLHYPAGASKWNPIERRLFCPISKNWQGTPLRTFETVLKYIRTTTTKTGLKVRAVLVSKKYPKGVKATKEDLKKLNIKRIKANPRWGYTISPHRKE
jgi:hypothetical protein